MDISKNQITTRVLVASGLLIAMHIILTRFLSIQTPVVRIGFGFLPLALSGMMFGPVVGAIVGALSDVIGYMINPSGGAFFPGFTFSAALSGAIYGFFLYKKPGSLVRTSLAVLIIMLVINLGLNTLWVMILTNKAAAGLFLPRLIKQAATYPVQVFTIYTVWHLVGKRIEPRLCPKTSSKV